MLKAKEQELKHLLETESDLSTLDFSKYVRRVIKRDAILIPLSTAEELYLDAYAKHKTMATSRLNSMMINFLSGSVEHCKKKRNDATADGMGAVSFDPFAASILAEIYHDLDMDLPKWWPEFYKQEAPEESEHRFECFWKWSTVPVEYIYSTTVPTVLGLAKEFLEGGDASEQRVFGDLQPGIKRQLKGLLTLKETIAKRKNEDQKQSVNVTEKTSSTAESVDSVLTTDSTEITFQKTLLREQESDVQLSLFAARKYLQKYDDSIKRNIPFSLTLADMLSLLRRRVCHFTKEKLVVNIGENYIQQGIIPDNYLTLDRLDPTRGYDPDNVVVCAHRINQLKAKLTEEQFGQVLSMHALMGGLGDQQKEALQVLLGANVN